MIYREIESIGERQIWSDCVLEWRVLFLRVKRFRTFIVFHHRSVEIKVMSMFLGESTSTPCHATRTYIFYVYCIERSIQISLRLSQVRMAACRRGCALLSSRLVCETVRGFAKSDN